MLRIQLQLQNGLRAGARYAALYRSPTAPFACPSNSQVQSQVQNAAALSVTTQTQYGTIPSGTGSFSAYSSPVNNCDQDSSTDCSGVANPAVKVSTASPATRIRRSRRLAASSAPPRA